MQYNNKSAIRTPIINKVITLNKALVEAGRKLPKGKKGANVVMPVDIRFDSAEGNCNLCFHSSDVDSGGDSYMDNLGSCNCIYTFDNI